MKNYFASVTYNKDTLETLGKVQNRCNTTHNFVYLALCLILILAGFNFGLNTTAGILCVALGCFCIPLLNATGKSATAKIIEALHGQSIDVQYSFYGNGFSCATQDKTTRFQYTDLKKLYEDTDHLYIFPSKNQAFMISKSSLKPHDLETFKKDLAKEAHLSWQNSLSILTFHLDNPLLRRLRKK